MMKIKTTYHALYEREERVTAILTNLSIGEPVCETKVVDDRNRETRHVLTNTGIIMIYNQEDALVTMLLATVKRAQAMYQADHLPSKIFNVICKNEKRYKFIYKIS